jgi:hypothetical protein
LVTVAGIRWAVEEQFQAGKGQVGLDHYQVRTWTGWHRFTTLAMLALAFLSVLAAEAPKPTSARLAEKLIPLTVPEIRRLLHTASTDKHRRRHAITWSRWRRRHQAQARRSHYKRRLAPALGP